MDGNKGIGKAEVRGGWHCSLNKMLRVESVSWGVAGWSLSCSVPQMTSEGYLWPWLGGWVSAFKNRRADSRAQRQAIKIRSDIFTPIKIDHCFTCIGMNTHGVSSKCKLTAPGLGQDSFKEIRCTMLLPTLTIFMWNIIFTEQTTVKWFFFRLTMWIACLLFRSSVLLVSWNMDEPGEVLL